MLRNLLRRQFCQSQQNLQEFFGPSLINNQLDLQALRYCKDNLNFVQQDFTYIHKLNNEIFQNSPEPLVKMIRKNYESAEINQIKRLIRMNPQIVMVNADVLEGQIDQIQKVYDLTFQEVIKIVFAYPKIGNQLLDQIDSLYKVFYKYLTLNHDQFGKIILAHPYIFDLDFKNIDLNLRNLRLRLFTKEQIIDLLTKNSDALTYSPKGLEAVWAFFSRLNIHGKRKNDIILKYPEFISLSPNISQHRKITFLKKMKVSVEQQHDIFWKYPQIYLKSVGSLKLKMRYLKQYYEMNFKKDKAFPAILLFNYSETIRPRGEAMRLSKNIKPWKDIIYLTDQEFCDYIDYSFDKFIQLKKERKTTNEVDGRTKFYSKWFNYERHLKR